MALVSFTPDLAMHSQYIENTKTMQSIHDIRNIHIGRACLAATAYYIRKLKWSMKKCLEFVSFRRPEFQPKPAYLRQLSKAAAYLDLTPSSKKQTHSSSSLLSSSSPNDAFSKRWLVPGQSVLGTLLRNTVRAKGIYIDMCT